MTVTRVVVSFPADLSGWGRDQLETPWFRAYLRRTLAADGEGDTAGARVGDTVDAFLDVGCCGDSLDVPLRVERVDGEGPIDEDTAVEYEEREACGLAGGWLVQSRAGPTGPERPADGS
jgi:hypothetical protein